MPTQSAWQGNLKKKDEEKEPNKTYEDKRKKSINTKYLGPEWAV
jgi:hypothetical protein